MVLCVTLFNNSDLTTLLGNATYRQNLIDNLLTQVQAGNADGINVDFESFPASQKQNMVQFITDLTNTFHTEIPGSQVTLATPAVDWNDGWDYNALATISDGLFIMGYDYYYSGSSSTGPNGQLHPVQQVRPLQILVQQNSMQKWKGMLFHMENYGMNHRKRHGTAIRILTGCRVGMTTVYHYL